MRCKLCGAENELQQRRAALVRWSRLSPAQRAAEMSLVRRLGLRRAKRARKNTQDQP